jgi:glycerol-3-phosphate dehydrogenase (NAD(P)+)
MKTAVLGAGAWGTALARHLVLAGNEVALWGRDADELRKLEKQGTNERLLPGIKLPAELKYEADNHRAIAGAEIVVVAVPSRGFREVTRSLQDFRGLIISVTKGIEHETGLTMCGILAENAPAATCAALSGPSFATEVAKGIPTAIVAASEGPDAAAATQQLFNTSAFRVYTNADVTGVELGGALKNVIAIAAGAGDGLGFGDNTKAALVTRAIVEIRRLGVACGAKPETFTGLSGLGDLMVTCFSRHSRNRGFGEKVGRGENAATIAEGMISVAEGYPTARSAHALAREKKVSTPVIDETYAMLYEGKDVREAVRDLMTRDLKAEE